MTSYAAINRAIASASASALSQLARRHLSPAPTAPTRPRGRRRRAVRVCLALDLGHQRVQRFGHASPELGELDLGHAPILPARPRWGPKPVSALRNRTFVVQISALPSWRHHSIGSTPAPRQAQALATRGYRSVRGHRHLPWTPPRYRVPPGADSRPGAAARSEAAARPGDTSLTLAHPPAR